MEPDFPWMIWINPPHSGLWRQPLSKRTLQLFLPSSLSPISVEHTRKHLESNSLCSPFLSHWRVHLLTGNIWGEACPRMQALLRYSVQHSRRRQFPAPQEGGGEPSASPNLLPASEQQAGTAACRQGMGGRGRRNLKAGESAGLRTCIRTQSSRRMHGYENGIHYYSIN